MFERRLLQLLLKIVVALEAKLAVLLDREFWKLGRVRIVAGTAFAILNRQMLNLL